ncbi:hypothetical protein GLAREA_09429 [Glarea lozoyensis ATCC 20868]|uniref:Uncharacterized protein n=1 Tax=Glarea lozoyensis (strain ATCC 20868 / MF5171) TaxID=1116229 RepID=S3CTG4_GLAL2|nr:uncharacterized protein GLAREA_09429 [Glarea lozoyensis ATCC 20868]EPE28309.1 hypothetical protein GLAREA_09429 [Glarea lozoyensis ATCC 20868]
MQELFDLSIKHHKDAQIWYEGSRPEVKQFAAEKLLWEDLGWKEDFPGVIKPQRNPIQVETQEAKTRTTTSVPPHLPAANVEFAQRSEIYKEKEAETSKSLSNPSPQTSSSIHSDIKDEIGYNPQNAKPDYSLESLLRSPIPAHVGLKWRGTMRFNAPPLYGKNEDGHSYWSVTTHTAGSSFPRTGKEKYFIIWVEDQRREKYIDKQTKYKFDRAWHFLYLWVWANQCKRLPRDSEDFLVDFLQLDVQNKLGKIPAQPSRPPAKLFKASALDLSRATVHPRSSSRPGRISSRDSRQYSDMGGNRDQSRSNTLANISSFQDIQQNRSQDEDFNEVTPSTRNRSQPRDMLTQTESFVRETESQTLFYRGRPR